MVIICEHLGGLVGATKNAHFVLPRMFIDKVDVHFLVASAVQYTDSDCNNDWHN